MKLNESVKPISYLKAHVYEVIRDVSEKQQETLVIFKREIDKFNK
ncbi:MAG TPA: hypothetical protein PKE38_02340 [Ignavibacteriaceae bacterium]|nr:hypothetical protein [Ignavibacteriaceae bacterium]